MTRRSVALIDERAGPVGSLFARGDGTEGCKKLKAHGGTTFAQDISAEVDGMPVSAQASGAIDFVLRPDQMPAKLETILRAFKKRH